MDFPLYVTWLNFHACFNIFSLFYIITILVLVCSEYFLFWPCLFTVLCASCIWRGMPFLSLEMFSTMILSLTSDSFISSGPIILNFVSSFLLSHVFCMFFSVLLYIFHIPYLLFVLDPLHYLQVPKTAFCLTQSTCKMLSILVEKRKGWGEDEEPTLFTSFPKGKIIYLHITLLTCMSWSAPVKQNARGWRA